MRLVFLLLACWACFTAALKQPTSYCKCTCFQNSTIIPLNSPPSESSSPAASPRSSLFVRDNDDSDGAEKTPTHHHTLTCNDCNRAFCLDYNLPICKNAKEEDVFTQCFQRDSFKDRTIVTLFILATASLLLWALLKPFIVKSGVGDVVQRYTPIRTGLSASEDDGTLPRPNANSRAGFGSERPGRSGGGRRSISRQGGLNS